MISDQQLYLDPVNNLGLVYHKQGTLEDTIAEYKKAIDLDSNNAEAHFNLAYVYSLKNEPEQAVEYLQKAIDLDKSLIENSKTDRDLDNIRQTPEYQQLINSE